MKVSFSPDIIPSGWLGSKHHLTNIGLVCLLFARIGFKNLRGRHGWHKPFNHLVEEESLLLALVLKLAVSRYSYPFRRIVHLTLWSYLGHPVMKHTKMSSADMGTTSRSCFFTFIKVCLERTAMKFSILPWTRQSFSRCAWSLHLTHWLAQEFSDGTQICASRADTDCVLFRSKNHGFWVVPSSSSLWAKTSFSKFSAFHARPVQKMRGPACVAFYRNFFLPLNRPQLQ